MKLWWNEHGAVMCAEHAPLPWSALYVKDAWERVHPENARMLTCDRCPRLAVKLTGSVTDGAPEGPNSMILRGTALA